MAKEPGNATGAAGNGDGDGFKTFMGAGFGTMLVQLAAGSKETTVGL